MRIRHIALSIALVITASLFLTGCSVSLPWKKDVSGFQVQITDGGSAQVFLDDLHLGQTPIQNQNLKPGVYNLRLEPGETGKQPYETQIRLYPGSITSVLWSFASRSPSGTGDILELEPLPSKNRAELSVITVPEGASVLLNSTTYGLSPVILDEIDPGDYQLSVNAVGHTKKTLAVQVQEGFRLHIFSRLEQEASTVEPTPDLVQEDATDSATIEDDSTAPNSPTTDTTADTAVDNPTPSPTPLPGSQARTRPTTTPEPPYVTITETGTGWLRVRDAASSAGAEVAKVDVGTNHPYLSTQNGWYQIEYAPGENGWISGQYATIVRE